MKKKLLVPLLAFLVATSATATGIAVNHASADDVQTGLETEAVANWTDGLTYNPDYAYGGGSGTAADPYLISEPMHLAQLAVNLNYDENITANYSQGKYFKLTQDIDVSGKNWMPIGNKIGEGRNNTFYGGFDFNGYGVSGISHTGYDGQLFGFFGALSVGWVKAPKISYGDVTVNYTGGENSIVDNSGVTTVASFGGVAGVMIGGYIGYDDGSDVNVDINIDGDVSFTNTMAGTRGYHGGIVGFFIGGVIGNGHDEGDTNISVEVTENGSMSFINNTGELIYAGGIIGNGYADGVVGNASKTAGGDVSISFVNNNADDSETGFYAESNGTGRCGLIAGEANFTMGSVGNGDSNVSITVENNDVAHYLFTKTQLNYCGGMFGSASGLKGTKGTGDVTIKLDNYGTIKAENNAQEEIRFGGVSGYAGGETQSVWGIDNAESDGDVYIAVLNHGDAEINRADNWKYYTGLQFGYMLNTIVGTKGTGDVAYVSQTKLGKFHNNNGPLAYPFINTKDAASALGSLNGGDAVEQSKTFGYFLTDAPAPTSDYGYTNSWERYIVVTDKMAASENASWTVTGANADGVICSLSIASGYGFDGYTDDSSVLMDENGCPYAVITNEKALPAVKTVALDSLTVDFTSVDYTGEKCEPSLDGYTIVALGEGGKALNATMPAVYNVYGVELYKDNVYVGTKTYTEAQAFEILKLNNSNTVDVSKVMIDPNTETYTVPSDIEVAADEAFTNVIANSGSVVAYKNGSIYVRLKETATHKAGVVSKVDVVAYTVTMQENAGLTVTVENKGDSFLNGAYYAFKVNVKDGYELDGFVVKANGTEITGDDGEYYILVDGNTEITFEGVLEIVYYDVTLPESEIATVAPVVDGQTAVREGGSFMFTVETEKEIIVKVNGGEVQAVGGIYKVDNVSEDIVITVEEVVEPEQPDQPTDEPTDEPADGEKSGCSATVGSTLVMGAMALGCAVVLKRRRK